MSEEKDDRSIGNNFTEELKFPITFFKFLGIPVEGGIRLNKVMIISSMMVLCLLILLAFVILGGSGVRSFIFRYFLVIAVLIPLVIFNLFASFSYDDKPILKFLRDLRDFRRNKHKAIDQFQTFDFSQVEADFVFEPVSKKEGGKLEKSNTIRKSNRRLQGKHLHQYEG